jgi:hypothetical protein
MKRKSERKENKKIKENKGYCNGRGRRGEAG